MSCLEDNSNLAKADSQVDGNWYSWYSATAGSEPKENGETKWNGGLAPDSICPKGWQLPTYSGDKSFTTLINTSYSMKNSSEESSTDSGVLSSPLSFLRSGYLYWNDAGLNARGGSGRYWSLRSAGTTYSYSLGFGNTYLYPQSNDNRGYGFAVRYELYSSFLELLKDFLKVFRRGH